MKEAKLSVIRFDAGDVIATSGDYFYMTPAGLAEYNGIDFGAIIIAAEPENIYLSGYDSTGTYFFGFGFEEGRYYHLVSNPENNEYGIYVELLGGKPESGTEIKSYAKVLEWLNTYGKG